MRISDIVELVVWLLFYLFDGLYSYKRKEKAANY